MPSTTTTTYTVTNPDGTVDTFVTTATCVETTNAQGVVTWVHADPMTKNGENPGNRWVHLELARDWIKTVVVT